MVMAEKSTAKKTGKLRGTPVLETGYVKEQLAAFKWPGGAPPKSLVDTITKTGSPRRLKETLAEKERERKKLMWDSGYKDEVLADRIEIVEQEINHISNEIEVLENV